MSKKKGRETKCAPTVEDQNHKSNQSWKTGQKKGGPSNKEKKGNSFAPKRKTSPQNRATYTKNPRTWGGQKGILKNEENGPTRPKTRWVLCSRKARIDRLKIVVMKEWGEKKTGGKFENR